MNQFNLCLSRVGALLAAHLVRFCTNVLREEQGFAFSMSFNVNIRDTPEISLCFSAATLGRLLKSSICSDTNLFMSFLKTGNYLNAHQEEWLCKL